MVNSHFSKDSYRRLKFHIFAWLGLYHDYAPDCYTAVYEKKSYSHQSQFAHIIFKETMENLPNEIVLQILGYLSLGELIQCARVSKRLSKICEDKSLSYRSNMQVMKD